jgi:hypothetical protein
LASGDQVIQLVISSSFPMGATMEQILLPLLCRLDAPRVLHPSEVATCRSYREAVQLCWSRRLVRNLTKAQLAERAGLYPPHVTCYLVDGKRQRDLPGWAVPGFERACDNTAISQWMAMHAKLTVTQELEAMRAVA